VTPQEFIQKWTASVLKESSAAQEHFIDLCRLLGQKTPAEADPDGSFYTFEKGAAKYGGGDGFADVWMKGHFAWEYKGKHKDLGAAYDQLLRYRESLDNPPLLVVCDMARFQIHTNFTGTTKKVHEFVLADIAREETRQLLVALFTDPEQLDPGRRVEQVTEDAARELASLAQSLHARNEDPKRVAHYLNRILFCLFAEDVGLLPRRIFKQVLEAGASNPEEFASMLRDLFTAMAHGGRFGVAKIHWFNGGLFADGDVIPLIREEIAVLSRIASMDWSQIEPAIFGTLFERGLDPSKRSQLGAHYTDRQSILRVVEPVLMAPLRRRWAVVQEEIEVLLARASTAKTAAVETKLRNQARLKIQDFRKAELDPTRVLDPACGSGNFLYVALDLLHELEKEILQQLAVVDLGQFSLDIRVGPHMVHGIELNTYAYELAQVTIWIGHFQWQLKNGFSFDINPVLKPIETIECRDAILDLSDPLIPKEAEWPAATVVVGNPPFLGGKRLRTELGDRYVDVMFAIYSNRVPREADLVTYWFEKARAAIEARRLNRAGLLATNSIRGGASRKVLERIRSSGQIFMAWSDEPWIVEGAAVRISLIGFDGGQESNRALDGLPVAVILPDLTGSATTGEAIELTTARRLRENLGIAFMGDTKGGPFDVPGDLARSWLGLPLNPNGRPNADVVRRWANGHDLTRRPRDMWIVDFGVDMPSERAALFEKPYQHVREFVKPERDSNRRDAYRERWWLHVEPRPAMRAALAGLPRFVATTRHAKHLIFDWLPAETLPDSALIAFARADDFFFGVLHSRFHEAWALRLCSWVGVGNDPRYTPTTTFETFPFPRATDPQRAAIAAAADELVRLRDTWLNPVGASEDVLKQRTLTNLYNQRPDWLANAHAALDSAVALAYGWPVDIGVDDGLRRLLALNFEREPA
jgi:type II restriction/modification system DNA methylase subunit YeeA